MSTWKPLQPPPAERDPRRVADSLDRIARSLGAPSTDVLTAVFAHWADLVGPDIAAHAAPRVLRGGVLTVVVDHPAWATQLRYLSATLTARLGQRTGSPGEITSLRIQVGDPQAPLVPDPAEVSVGEGAWRGRGGPGRRDRRDGRDGGDRRYGRQPPRRR